MLTRRILLASAALVPLAPAVAVAVPANRQAPQVLIDVFEYDFFTAFTLIKNGKYVSATFRNNNLLYPADGVWDVKDGAVPFHTSVRDAHEHEAVTVSGAKLMPKLYKLLDDLIADTLQPKTA